MGKKKRVFIYRFLSTGTIEEKVFQRQMSKEGLQKVIQNEQTDKTKTQACIGTMDGIIDTVPASHPVEDLIDLLKRDGKLILLGALGKPVEVPVVPMLVGRKVIAGSAAGGLKETQEMLEFAAHHDITADVEVIAMDYVNTAMERLEKGDVRYRFVIDIGGNSTITKAAA